MKKILAIALFFVSCNGGLTPGSLPSLHEVRYSPDGKDSIACVKYFDGNQYNTFCMGYALFKDVYDKEGYEGCYEYYLSHELPEFWLKEYKQYKKLK